MWPGLANFVDMIEVGRFAPSTTGPAHAGTLLAGLLCWLDTRGNKGRLVLRLEDLDPHRSKPHWVAEMSKALEWLGLDWDVLERQSEVQQRYVSAVESLFKEGLLYPCSCSRQDLASRVSQRFDGLVPYDGKCRDRSLPPGGWEDCSEPLRLRCDEPASDSSEPFKSPWMGDPLIRRRDGAFSYHLASVVDDAILRVTRICRGRDLEPSMRIQNVLQDLLQFPRPIYHHHFLLLEGREKKLAKIHGSMSWSELRKSLHPDQLTGQLAYLMGLLKKPIPVSPVDLLESFSWEAIRRPDLVVSWDRTSLSFIAIK